jgi:hypothetical protein
VTAVKEWDRGCPLKKRAATGLWPNFRHTAANRKPSFGVYLLTFVRKLHDCLCDGPGDGILFSALWCRTLTIWLLPQAVLLIATGE